MGKTIKAPDLSGAGQKIYIVELANPRERLEAQFVPEEINWDRSGNWQSLPVIARNHDNNHLTGGNDSIKLSFDFYADDIEKESVLQRVKWLQSLTYVPARRVKIIFGDLFLDETWIVLSVKSRLTNFISYKNLKPRQAYVDIVFKQETEENLTIEDVRI
jgi:hypothetical protein